MYVRFTYILIYGWDWRVRSYFGYLFKGKKLDICDQNQGPYSPIFLSICLLFCILAYLIIYMLDVASLYHFYHYHSFGWMIHFHVLLPFNLFYCICSLSSLFPISQFMYVFVYLFIFIPNIFNLYHFQYKVSISY